jgi:hypothetical protein
MGNSNSGRGGLPRELRREIERLLSARWKNAHIARKLGIDVSTVSRYKRRMKERGAESRESGAKQEEEQTVRCGGCGGLVLVSVGYCIVCYQRKTNFREVPRVRRSQKARFAA